MTVSELIEFLKGVPQDLLVAHQMYSEFCLLEADSIVVGQACDPRPDGWIHRERPDRTVREYLMFPGN